MASRRFLAVVLTLTLVAGCGSSPDKGSDTKSPVPTPSVVSQQERPSSIACGYVLKGDLGGFEPSIRAGLPTSWKEVRSADSELAQIDAMLDQSVDCLISLKVAVEESSNEQWGKDYRFTTRVKCHARSLYPITQLDVHLSGSTEKDMDMSYAQSEQNKRETVRTVVSDLSSKISDALYGGATPRVTRELLLARQRAILESETLQVLKAAEDDAAAGRISEAHAKLEKAASLARRIGQSGWDGKVATTVERVQARLLDSCLKQAPIDAAAGNVELAVGRVSWLYSNVPENRRSEVASLTSQVFHACLTSIRAKLARDDIDEARKDVNALARLVDRSDQQLATLRSDVEERAKAREAARLKAETERTELTAKTKKRLKGAVIGTGIRGGPQGAPCRLVLTLSPQCEPVSAVVVAGGKQPVSRRCKVRSFTVEGSSVEFTCSLRVAPYYSGHAVLEDPDQQDPDSVEYALATEVSFTVKAKMDGNAKVAGTLEAVEVPIQRLGKRWVQDETAGRSSSEEEVSVEIENK